MGGENHLTKPQQYALVYSRGSSWGSTLLVMWALPNGLALSRYGCSVSKRVGKAVIRNKVKRLLRETLRVTPLRAGWDVVFMARPAAATADYAGLSRSVADLLARAHLLVTGEERRWPVEVEAKSGE